MTDIVKRLRAWAYISSLRYGKSRPTETMEEAAREIERLRTALRELLAAHDEDIGMEHHDDDESVGWQGDEPLKLTFGTLRRARAVLGEGP